MTQYNHAFTLGFSVISATPDGEDVTPEMFRAALVERMRELDRTGTWSEACDAPFDTYTVDEEPDTPASAP